MNNNKVIGVIDGLAYVTYNLQNSLQSQCCQLINSINVRITFPVIIHQLCQLSILYVYIQMYTYIHTHARARTHTHTHTHTQTYTTHA